MLRCQIFTVLCVSLCMVLANQTEQNSDVATLREGSLKFAASLYKVLSEKEGNLLISPLSIHSVLTMLCFGARADTAQQMTKTLSLPSHDVTSRGYKKLRELIKPEKSIILGIANNIYPGEKAKLLPEFLEQTEDVFASEAEVLDYTKIKKAAYTINNWVEGITSQKIKNTIEPNMLSKNTAMVLVSAVYFKGMWEKPFIKLNDQDFHMKSGTVKVPMIQKEGLYQYMEKNMSRILEVPYGEKKLSMFVILPAKTSDLKVVEAYIESGGLNINDNDLKNTLVDILLPTFTFEYSTQLDEVLRKLGMSIIYKDGVADFGGMIGDVKTKVDRVIHKTFIDIHESGTEAPAGTDGVMAVAQAAVEPPAPPIEFYVDQPFIYFLQHKETGQVLFLGRCEDPRK